ncbi:MAG: DNA repair protein RadA [Pseudomonadota bacterium]
MVRSRSQFVCQQCGSTSAKWYGKCPECQAWNSFVEEVVSFTPSKGNNRSVSGDTHPMRLNEINDERIPRIALPFPELNRVLGNGLTRGSVALLAGDPGIGKSTLLLQLLGELGRKEGPPLLYVSGEESARQLRLRSERLGIDGSRIFVLAETDLSEILGRIEELKPEIVVIDSVQTLYWPELDSVPGSVSQVKEVADRLIRLAKQRDFTVFLVGHVTKDGSIAGPMALEHLVDTVLYFEGERGQPYRILRAAKNRFGPTDEIAVYDMHEEGLKEVLNPSELFLRDRPIATPGTVVFPAMEGSRPLLVEIQGLATRSSYGVPLRASVGFDKNRLTMLLAVLEKRAGLHLSGEDVYVNVVGGVRITEPAADLAVVAAVVSSFLGKVFPNDSVIFGEVGLAGEIRGTSRFELRMKEALKLGFRSAFAPSTSEARGGSLRLVPVKSVGELVDSLR